MYMHISIGVDEDTLSNTNHHGYYRLPWLLQCTDCLVPDAMRGGRTWANHRHRSPQKHRPANLVEASCIVTILRIVPARRRRLTTRRRHKPPTMAAIPTSLFRWVVPAAIGASVVQSSLYDVKGGTRAVIFDRLSGVKENVVNEGTHFLVPWLQRAIVFDVRTRPRNISTTTGSKDLQMVTLTLRVLHRPEVKQLPKIYQVCPLCSPHVHTSRLNT
jgi:hypothetical protein